MAAERLLARVYAEGRSAVGALIVLATVVGLSTTAMAGGLGVAAVPGAAGAPSASHPAVANNTTSWINITGTVGPAPYDRSISAAAYSPALNETILFGGYNGAGGNFPLGDTWEFSNNQWTELNPSTSPTPRWGDTMVYDPVDQALVLFGGRNATAFFNDTWEFNATGWHEISTSTAPSPRYDYGLVYDSALGAVVLFGGGIGNNPAGTFDNFVFYNDTWTFQNGTWTNITASAGPAPTGRLIRDQMVYDAAVGAVILTGGFSFDIPSEVTSCGYVQFSPGWSGTWTFTAGGWAAAAPASGSPPDGTGVVWYDAQANETLYYQGLWLAPGGLCDISGNRVWSYQADNWTLVTEGVASAPVPRLFPVFVDDLGDNEQVEFGGQIAATASESYGAYISDTWTYAPTWVTFNVNNTPAGAHWKVTIEKTVRKSTGQRMLFVEAPGKYTYHYALLKGTHLLRSGTGTVSLHRRPTAVLLKDPGVRDYAVTFTETGLTDGSWSVTIKGVTETAAAGAPITFTLANGTYAYRIGAEAGLKHAGAPKAVRIKGSGESVLVTFRPARG